MEPLKKNKSEKIKSASTPTQYDNDKKWLADLLDRHFC